jgi:hypothetical protein
LATVDGLVSLESVVDISLNNLDSLVSIVGLESVEISGALVLADNQLITDIPGFSGAANISVLAILSNPSLVSITGLDNLGVVRNDFTIRDNQLLPSCVPIQILSRLSLPPQGTEVRFNGPDCQ